MDFLGLRNLTVIRDALELIKKNHGVTIDFSKMTYDDKKTLDLFSSGNTQGVFQFESSGITQFLKNLKPDCFEDIVAANALYRPGPMASIPTYIENKKNPEKIQYVDKNLKPILSVTYGCLIYQEQVMQIVRDLAGYTYGRSDLVRRAMSKKKMDIMLQEQEYFVYGKDREDGTVEIKGCVRNGISETAAKEIYNQMISFAEYAFNKSHAAAYSVLAYQTAYLKCYFPVEFMAALMTSVIGDSAQIAKYSRNCGEMKIEGLPPDINESSKKFTVKDNKIRFGLLGVKNVGEGVIDAIVRMREEKGAPVDIFQFINNVDIHEINKKAVESLIKAGAMDCLNENRAKHLAVFESLIESAQNNSRKNIEGQMSLFQMNADSMQGAGLSGKLPDVANFTKDFLMAMEKEMLGVYLTGHPLSDYAEKIEKVATVTSEDLVHAEGNEGIQDGMTVTMAGMVSSKKTLITKKNKMMAFVQLEDLYGTTEVIVFPNVYEAALNLLKNDKVIAVRGTINFKEDEEPKLLADKIFDIESFGDGAVPSSTVKITIPQGLDEARCLSEIREIIMEHKGDTPVVITAAETGKKYKTKSNLWVSVDDSFIFKLSQLVGKDNVQ